MLLYKTTIAHFVLFFGDFSLVMCLIVIKLSIMKRNVSSFKSLIENFGKQKVNFKKVPWQDSAYLHV